MSSGAPRASAPRGGSTLSETEQAAGRAELLARLDRIFRLFKTERRMEDEPAQHDKALERVAEKEESR